MPATPTTSLSDLVLSRTTLDRAAHRRREPGLLQGLLTDPATQVLDVFGDRVCVVEDHLVLRSVDSADAGRLAVFLGADAGSDVVAVDRGADETPEDAVSMRDVGLQLAVRDVGILTTALGILNWQRTQGFCPRCGQPATVSESGWGRTCTQDGTEHYPRTDAAVIMSVIDDDDRLLLARGTRFGGQNNRMSVLAGFVEPGESLEHAVAREVFEEVGVTVSQIDFCGDQPWPFPASLMVGFAARATTTRLVLDPLEIAAARWFSREELADGLRAGSLGVPPALSIARHLIEDWYGGELPEVAGQGW